MRRPAKRIHEQRQASRRGSPVPVHHPAEAIAAGELVLVERLAAEVRASVCRGAAHSGVVGHPDLSGGPA
jgi:hypothetical protein